MNSHYTYKNLLVEIEMLPLKNISYQFMKYLRPIWYFHLKPNNSCNFWPDYQSLNNEQKKIINYDNNYSNKKISNWDASYQALLKGIVVKNIQGPKLQDIDICAIDIYNFVRKYNKSFWVYITFFQRIFLLNNPFSELFAIWKTRKIKNINIYANNYNYSDYQNYSSDLLKKNPNIIIIIPTYNRYDSLFSVLTDLNEQKYTNFKVMIIDQSNPYNHKFYNELDDRYTVIRQNEPALWQARNRGVINLKSDYYLFLDDDTRVESDWIIEHIKCLDYFKADISSGISISQIGSKTPANYSFFRLSDQIDTGNVMIKRDVFKECGLFDEQFEKMRMGDAEFGLRSYIKGFKNISNPFASRLHLKDSKGGLRDMGHWDVVRSKKFMSPRPIPSALYFYRKYWGNKAAMLSCVISVPFNLLPYKYKRQSFSPLLSFILFILFSPLFIMLVIKSWIKSTKMLSEGEKITTL